MQLPIKMKNCKNGFKSQQILSFLFLVFDQTSLKSKP